MLSGQIILLLFSWSSSKTTSGLEDMNKKTDLHLLILSILLSWKSICFTSLKTIKISKSYLPFTTSFLLFPWIIISASIRILVVVLYFTPGFGLFSILNHWKFEQTKFSDTLNAKFTNNSQVHLVNGTVSWKDINRWSYTNPEDPTPPPYTLYTGYTLQEYFLGFWTILMVHIYANVLVKIATSNHLRQNCSVLELIVHGFENTNIAIVYKDWDIDSGTVEERRKRRKSVLAEMILTMLVKAAVHSFMAVGPIFLTGIYKNKLNIFFSKNYFLPANKIQERHDFLSKYTGFFQAELDSLHNINKLCDIVVWLLPTLTILEIGLYILYQMKVNQFYNEIL